MSRGVTIWRSYAEIVQAAHAEERRFVEVERLGDRAVLRLADADKLNVLSAPLMVQLLEQAERAHAATPAFARSCSPVRVALSAPAATCG